LEIKLAIEVDGGQHDEQRDYDASRTRQLQAAGFEVLRFWNHEVLQDLGAVKERIFWAVTKRMIGCEKTPIPTLALPLKEKGSN
jgi:very-short-patch-repair endonuclease